MQSQGKPARFAMLVRSEKLPFDKRGDDVAVLEPRESPAPRRATDPADATRGSR